MRHPFIWADAFTDKPFAGNPCAVVFDADDVPEATRLAFTRETRLSECAFLQRSTRADFGVRYYVASGEILFAGHPTVATVLALHARGLIAAPCAFTLEVGAGVISVELSARREVTITAPRPVFGKTWAAEEIAPLVGLPPSAIAAPPQTVSTGTPFCVTLLKDAKTLAKAALDVPALKAFQTRPDCDFGEPFLVTLGGATEQGDIQSRLLLAPPEPDEDPFTGSATCCGALYLWKHGLIADRAIVAEQGHHMGRPGRGKATCIGPLAAPEGVRLTGAGTIVMQGEVFF